MALKLEEGKAYKSRNGEIWDCIVICDDNLSVWCDKRNSKDGYERFTITGIYNNNNSNYDLVEEA